MAIPPLKAFVRSPRCVLGFDPGETTGACFFQGTSLLKAGQLKTKVVNQDSLINLTTFFDFIRPDEVVIEDYRVYGWKTEEHAFAGLHTPKLIGMIITICIIRGLPYTLRMAQPAKAFVTDEKLEAWGLYDRGQRHSRDAMRHAIFQMIFPGKDVSKDEDYRPLKITED